MHLLVFISAVTTHLLQDGTGWSPSRSSFSNSCPFAIHFSNPIALLETPVRSFHFHIHDLSMASPCTSAKQKEKVRPKQNQTPSPLSPYQGPVWSGVWLWSTKMPLSVAIASYCNRPLFIVRWRQHGQHPSLALHLLSLDGHPSLTLLFILSVPVTSLRFPSAGTLLPGTVPTWDLTWNILPNPLTSLPLASSLRCVSSEHPCWLSRPRPTLCHLGS